MKGKQRCKILKEIRKEIAASNDIKFVTSECKHQGDCLGTCPKCEEEVRYLERELERRQKLGKTVVIAGLTASIAAASAGCVDYSGGNNSTIGNIADTQTVANDSLMGDIMPPSSDTETNIVDIVGAIAVPETFIVATDIYQAGEHPEADGDIAYFIAPELESLLSLNQEELAKALSGYNRNDVRMSWADAKSFLHDDGADTFFINETDYIEIYYDENGYIDRASLRISLE